MTNVVDRVFGVIEVRQEVTVGQTEKIIRKALESASLHWLDINFKCKELQDEEIKLSKSQQITRFMFQESFTRFDFFRNTRTGEVLSIDSQDFLDGVKVYVDNHDNDKDIDNCHDKMADQIMQLTLLNCIAYR